MALLLLRQWRHRRGLTLCELAERAGVHPVTVVKIEQGRQSPTVGLLVKLSRGLGVSPRALLSPRAEEDASASR